MKRLSCLLIVGLISVGSLFSCADELLAASAFQSRTSDAAGVRVVVMPRALTAGAATWEFDVTLDTHTKPLNDDLVAVSVLVDEQGRSTKPSSWQGDAPGGHHRKGILKFFAPAGSPTAFELQMKSVGGVDLRTFRWELK
jgi:hypothetical protein